MTYDDRKRSQAQGEQASQSAPASEPSLAPGKRARTRGLSSRPSGGPVQRTPAPAVDAARQERAELTARWLDTAIRPDLHAPPVQRQEEASASTPESASRQAGAEPALTVEDMQQRLAELAALFSTSSPDPSVCDGVAEEVRTWIQHLGQRDVLRSIHAAGFLDAWLRGMSPEIRSYMSSILQVTAEAQEVDPEERIQGTANEERARTALQEIGAIQQAADPQGLRLTHGIIDILVRAVAEPRTDDANGQEGILGVHQAVRAARALAAMMEQDYASIVARLAMSGGGASTDIQTQNALILKAVAARHDDYVERAAQNGPVAGGTDPDQEIRDFADAIAGMDNDALIRDTSLIDLDAGDGRLGTRQRFTMSCAPTSAIMARGEVDPIYALRLRQSGDVSDNQQAHDLMADEQRRLLEQYGQSSPGASGQARAIVAEDNLPVLQSRIQTLSSVPGITTAARIGLMHVWRHATNQPFNPASEAPGLMLLRARHGGFPTERLLADMREYSSRTNVGLTDPETESLVQDHVGEVNDAAVGTDTTLGGTGRTTKQLLDAAAAVLERGLDVPFGVTWVGGGGHVMLMTDVRAGAGTTHDFLVSDPATGNTAWVTETDILVNNLSALALGNGVVDASWLQVPNP